MDEVVFVDLHVYFDKLGCEKTKNRDFFWWLLFLRAGEIPSIYPPTNSHNHGNGTS